MSRQKRGFSPCERKISNRGGKIFARGFTLVELLVVIAIIALLMSMLMPALGMVREQAKGAMCMQMLKQWGLIWSLYLADYDGYFPIGYIGNKAESTTWQNAFRERYYGDDPEIRCCPKTTKTARQGGKHGTYQWEHFGLWSGSANPNGWDRKGDYGSYGANAWVYNPPLDMPVSSSWDGRPRPTIYNWRNAQVKGAGYIPLFLDCQWSDAWPEDWNAPGEHEFIYWPCGMGNFGINRHKGAIQGCFLDFSVKKIGLKQLWKVKWHRRFDINGGPVTWPDWMKNFKDYEL